MPPAPIRSRLLRTIAGLGSALLVACTEEAAVSRDAAPAMDLGVDVGPLPKDLGGADEAAIDAGADEAAIDVGRADVGRADAGFRLEVPVDPMGVPAPGSECTGDAGARTGDPTIAPPRPILPQSVSRVTSQRPSFRWALPEGTTGARVEVCADRCCTRVVASIEAEGTTVRPTEALPPGVVYWRMFGRRAGATGSRASYTWEFEVRRRDTPVDSSWGTIRDFTGDGYDDVLLLAGRGISDLDTADLFIAEGSATGPRPLHSVGPVPSVTAPWARMGDFNGDGRADMAYQMPTYTLQRDTLVVLEGHEAGPRRVRSPSIASLPYANFSTPIATDWNGDGYSDIVVSIRFIAGAVSHREGLGSVLAVYHGSSTGIGAIPQELLRYPSTIHQRVVLSYRELGDLDLDGYGDLYVESLDVDVAGEVQFVLHRSVDGLPIATPIPDPPTGGGGRYPGRPQPSPVGDLDGDNRPEFVLVPEMTTDVLVYRGATGLDAPAISLRGRDVLTGGVVNGDFGRLVAGADLNGDGFGDLVVSSRLAYTETVLWIDGSEDPYNSGRMYVFWGRADGVARDPIWFDRVRPTDMNDNPGFFAESIVSAGDLDGDGIDDAVLIDSGRAQVCYVRGSPSLSSAHLSGCERYTGGLSEVF